ncbi:glucuronate isomerase [Abyssalbus ytuae]|uniref:Uronate isomerase n=1 Tax=Abyssalbus ytuae TaxID=2926907 RepID=A0A9E6ZY53_9FLAO|nr:glucuronate isomerase [Abyssalbus ytuae]UOB19096.1 glucuronate isomerase [Abyssalbus ytuae]
MEKFIHDDFLLETKTAKELYHDYAKKMPLIDYHSHLSPDYIAYNKQFANLTELWIEGDHYKWRAMRMLGIEEKYISGNAPDRDKFEKWAYTVPYTLRNPLFHWSHLELKRYFNIPYLLKPETARKIYDHCNELISTPEFSAGNLIKKMKVKVVCTTDDPVDNLSSHEKCAEGDFEVKVLPTFRPDNILEIDKPEFNKYVEDLAGAASTSITSFETLLEALQSRINYFHLHGCRLSDHGLPYVYSKKFTYKEADSVLKKKLKKETISHDEVLTYKSALLHYLGKMYHEKGWVMQLHLGPVRNVNEALLVKIGANAGADSIGDFQHAEALGEFLNGLNNENSLPKTILYNVNPSDNEVFATMSGNFSSEDIKGKVQFGAAWWFLDQKDGITKQINALSNMALLSCSVGMLTDSRSFMSFPRHEYFRRILCNIFGNDVKKGELPDDIKWAGKIIQDICYYNAREYFNFPSVLQYKSETTIK